MPVGEVGVRVRVTTTVLTFQESRVRIPLVTAWYPGGCRLGIDVVVAAFCLNRASKGMSMAEPG
jgi:hypothetical protein